MSKFLDTLSQKSGFSTADILRVANNGPNRYKVFLIPKRSGGTRKIAQPARELKHLQRSVVEILSPFLAVHPSATAYQLGKGILQNASPHRLNDHILKLDFVDFFGTLTDQDFFILCLSKIDGLEPPDIAVLKNLLFWKDRERPGLRLSIGAPSSPFLSNVMMFEIDAKISDYCFRRSITYTRYADDLTFSSSSKDELRDVLAFTKQTISGITRPRLSLNEKKTTFVSKRFSRRVTGLVLSNQGNVSIGHNKKRILRAKLHRFKLGQLSADEIDQLRGYLAFSKSVDPAFITSMEKKYGADLLRTVLQMPRRRTINLFSGHPSAALIYKPHD